MTVAKPRNQFDKSEIRSFITWRFRRLGRSSLTAALLISLSMFSILASGYYLTYTLFFVEMPIHKLSRDLNGGVEESFMYPGAAYFRGIQLSHGEELRLEYVVPQMVPDIPKKEVEFFIQMEQYAQDSAANTDSGGRLVVAQGPHVENEVIELRPVEFQRHKLTWHPRWGKLNEIRIRFEGAPSTADQDAPPTVTFGTNIRNVNFWSQTLSWLAISALAIGLAVRIRPAITFSGIAAVGLPLFFMYFVHSGAFISNDMFGAPLRVTGMGSAFKSLWSDGTFSPVMYRGTGVIYLPIMTMLVEWNPGGFVLRPQFVAIYPTWRFISFATMAISTTVLLIALYRQVGAMVAFTTGILVSLFVPYITDIYYPDSDAYFIPMAILITGLFIMMCTVKARSTHLALMLGISALLFGMMSIKIQPAFFALLLPLALYAQNIFVAKNWKDRTALVFLAVLLIAVVAGNYVRTAFHHPDRNVGIEGVRFQSHNFWSQLWGMAGYYDKDDAHGSTQHGSLRRKRVVEATGLPNQGYVHHSQAAAEVVYRPAVINIFAERPGHFYSYIFMRLYEDVLRFQRYSQGREFLHAMSRDDRVDLIRHSEFWKLAPLALLIQFVQHDLTKPMEYALIFMALVGIALVRRVDLMVFLYGLAASQYAYGMLLHVQTRYFNFANISLLIGLALFIVALVSALRYAVAEKPRG